MCRYYTQCVEWFVLDSSSLITLARADALDLLVLAPHAAITVSAVYRETVETAALKAHAEAREIARCFDEKQIVIRDPRRRTPVPGVSRVDSTVIRLAEELGAADLLTNDRALLRKAEQRGLRASFTAEFVLRLCAADRIARQRQDELFRAFIAHRRYSAQFLEALTLGA